jgi:hypothetical protein
MQFISSFQVIVYGIFSLQGKRPLGRPRHRWVDNIEMDLREIEWDSMDCDNICTFKKFCNFFGLGIIKTWLTASKFIDTTFYKTFCTELLKKNLY